MLGGNVNISGGLDESMSNGNLKRLDLTYTQVSGTVPDIPSLTQCDAVGSLLCNQQPTNNSLQCTGIANCTILIPEPNLPPLKNESVIPPENPMPTNSGSLSLAYVIGYSVIGVVLAIIIAISWFCLLRARRKIKASKSKSHESKGGNAVKILSEASGPESEIIDHYNHMSNMKYPPKRQMTPLFIPQSLFSQTRSMASTSNLPGSEFYGSECNSGDSEVFPPSSDFYYYMDHNLSEKRHTCSNLTPIIEEEESSYVSSALFT